MGLQAAQAKLLAAQNAATAASGAATSASVARLGPIALAAYAAVEALSWGVKKYHDELANDAWKAAAEGAEVYRQKLEKVTGSAVSATEAVRYQHLELADKNAARALAIKEGISLAAAMDKVAASHMNAKKAVDENAKALESSVAAMVKERQEAAARLEIRDHELDKLDRLADAAAKDKAQEAALAAELGRVAAAHKTTVDVIQKLVEEREKNRDATKEEISSLAKLADATDNGRATVKEYEAALESLAKKRGVSVQEIRNEVEAKKQEIQANKDSIPVYKNVAEAMEGPTSAATKYENALRGEIKAINDLALAESARINLGTGESPAKYQKDYNSALEDTERIRAAIKEGGSGDGAEDMDRLIVAKKRETETYMLAMAAQAKADEDAAAAKNKLAEATDEATLSGVNFSEQLSKAGMIVVSYTENLRGLHGQIVELNAEQNKMIDGLARTAGQYSLTNVEALRLVGTLEKKLQLIGDETDWMSNQKRRDAIDWYNNSIRELAQSWQRWTADMPRSAVQIADLMTQLQEMYKYSEQLRKSFGG
jgi:hypothetical protein